MDLLLDVNIVLDLCAPRMEWYRQAKDALSCCTKQGGRLWLYTGSIQTIEYNLRRVLLDNAAEQGQRMSGRAAGCLARSIAKEFSEDKQWLAALAGEGNVFDTDDPEDEQLLRALDRFQPGAIKLLTRDQLLLDSCPEKTISPQQYCRLPINNRQLNFIDLKSQQDIIRPRLEKNIHSVLNHDRYILGSEVQEFEEKLADFVGVKHCIGVSSGTDALLMGLMAKGIGPGDAVFTTPFTFIATAEIISLLGATPVFVDIDPRTFNIDPAQLKLAIEAVKANDPTIYPLPQPSPLNPQHLKLSTQPSALKTQHSTLSTQYAPLIPKAIIPVDLFGLPADYDPIMQLAEKHNLFLLEDAAQGLGGVYKGKQAGSLGHMAATSFFPAKPIGCYGDGGAILTDDDELADLSRSIRVHGKGSDKYDNIRIGVNARLHTMQAAILLPKLKIFPKEIKERQRVAEKYTKLLNTQNSALNTQHSTIIPPPYPGRMQKRLGSIFYPINQQNSYSVPIKGSRNPLHGVLPTPLHMQTAFSHLDYKPENFSVSVGNITKHFQSANASIFTG